MKRSRRISIALPAAHHAKVRLMVESGEFRSAAAVAREALRLFLQRRSLRAGVLGAERLRRVTASLQEAASAEPFERVELLFDAGDAKA
jgi:Arc/MetJ-type ribon-helix-helix transcriptional regulator